MMCKDKEKLGVWSDELGVFCTFVAKSVNQNDMSKKFPYGYDINVYLDKAFEKMKETFFWATKEMLREDLENAPGLKEFLGYWPHSKSFKRDADFKAHLNLRETLR